MITKEEYKKYLGVTAPENLERLEYLAINELKSIMVRNVPAKEDIVYDNFKKAVMEQIQYLNFNSDLIDSPASSGYTLGSYSEEDSNQNYDNSKSINRISPVAHDILLNCGLLYCGVGGVY